MQLQLIPPAPHPAILFSFTLPAFPAELPFPPAYAAQLQLLLNTDLDPPPSPYALDKAVWPVYLIDLVSFDLTPSKRTVTVRMLDGAIIQWPMHGEEALLSKVMDDVLRSGREAERERREELSSISYLPLTNSTVLSNTIFREELSSSATEKSSNSRHSHRKSKSIFTSLLSALNLTSSSEQRAATPLPVPYRCGSKRAFEYDIDSIASSSTKNFMTILSTSEFTYPPREQLPRKTLATSRALRRQARTTLVDCFRRWVIPIVRERIQWGSFAYWDGSEDPSVEEGAKWGKMSKATNAYADWACRSMINRCEMALTIAERSLLQQESLSLNTPKSEMSEKESRRSSASSTLASAISASSRASSSHEQVDGMDNDDGPVGLILEAAQRTPRPSTSTSVDSHITASARHAATLRTALDRFKGLHNELTQDALGLADSHTMAMRILEERGRRKGWSSCEGNGLCRSPLGLVAAAAATTPSRSQDEWPSLPQNEYGNGNSIWEMSIPLIRSSLGEISSTWEDWQMEWEMEREFGSDDEFDADAFPDVISEFDTAGDAISSIDMDLSSRTLTMPRDASDTAECHSEFSDSSSEGEPGDSDVSPTSPLGFITGSPSSEPSPNELPEPPSPGTILNAKRSRKTGVKARLGTYEDVRDELPPNPPLLELSPPPRSKNANKGKDTADGVGSYDKGAFSRAIQNSSHLDVDGLRPPRGARPARLLGSLGRVPSAHKREAAMYAEFTQSRVSDVQAGVFDVWEEMDEEDTIFNARGNAEIAHIHQRAKKDKIAAHSADGLGILEQVGGSGNPKWQGPKDAGIGFPPGLHGNFSSSSSPSSRESQDGQERGRRTSLYIPRGPPITQQPTVDQTDKLSGRAKPQLSLTFPDPPTHHPSDRSSPQAQAFPSPPNSAPPSVTTFGKQNTPSSPSSFGPVISNAHVRPLSRGVSAPPSIITTSTFEEDEEAVVQEILTQANEVDDYEEEQEELTVDVRSTAARLKDAETPALLLDTPTAEYPQSTYPYTWELSVVPKGVVVVGTVGVAEGREGSKTSKGKVSKPLLCVTPPPAPAPRRPSLSRSKSWIDLPSGDKTVKNVLRRRKSADSRRSPSPTPEPSPSASNTDSQASTSSPISNASPVSLSASTSYASVPSLTVSSSTSSSLASIQSTVVEYEEDILADEIDFSPKRATSSGSSSTSTNNQQRTDYDGILMANHHTQQSHRLVAEEEETVQTTKEESYHIPDIWFTKPKSSTLGRTKSMSLKKATAHPPPPRPAKSLKRSLSLNGFAKRIASSSSSSPSFSDA